MFVCTDDDGDFDDHLSEPDYVSWKLQVIQIFLLSDIFVWNIGIMSFPG